MSGHTPTPWRTHSFHYPGGLAGDVFARDAENVGDCTPICRVTEPVSLNAVKARGKPLDALEAIGRNMTAAPIIEANAAFIVLACNSHGELMEALEAARLAVGHLASLERLRGHATATTAGVLERINAALSKVKAKGEAL